MRTRSVAAALLIALSPITFTVPGFAQATDDPTVKAARARFNEGVEFFDKGQFENARASFLQAYALRKHPAVLLNLAQSSVRSGHALEAAKYFQQYLRESTGLTAAQRADAEKGLSEARTKLGRVEVSAPAGAELFVDGEHVGTAPLSAPIDVEPGAHTLKANAESRTVMVAVAQLVPVKFAVGASVVPVPVPIPAPLPTPPTPAPEEPPTALPAPPPSVETPTVAPAVPPPSEGGAGIFSPPRSMAPFWVGVSVAVVGGATAVLFDVFKGSANSNYETTQAAIDKAYGGTPPKGFCVTNTPSRFNQACQNLQTDFNQVNSDATAGNVALVIGLAGLAFSAVYYLAAPKGEAKDGSSPAPPSATGRIAPVIEPHYQGLAYSLAF